MLLKAIEDGTPERLHGLAEKLGSVADVTKTLRSALDTFGGPAVDVGLGVWAIADGAEPVDVVVQWAGGLGAMGIAGAVIAGVALPALVPAIVLGAVDVLGTAIAGNVWQATPASWRTGIYEFTEDGYIIVGDMGEKIGDWFADRSVDIGQWFN